MALIRWNPWNLSSIMEDDWEFPTIPGLTKLGQGLNLYETKDAVVAEAAMPGIPEEQIDVTIDDGVVRITGTSQKEEADKSGRRYFMSSLASHINYSFRLPEGLTEKEPVCELENGILKLVFDKLEKAPPKKVKVVSKKKAQ